MPRGRKPIKIKRVKIEIWVDMVEAAFSDLKPKLHEIVDTHIAEAGKLAYLTVDVETLE